MRMLSVVFLVGCLSACGGETKTHPFEDSTGRDCVFTCGEEDCSFSCEADPAPARGCADDAEPCFTLSYYAPDDALGLCDSCCSDGVSGYFEDDCSQLVCLSDDDCPVSDSVCEDGLCWKE